MFDDLTFALRYESVVNIAVCGVVFILPIPLAQDIVDRLKRRGYWQSLVGASNFDLPAQLHDPVRGNAEELGRIQGEVAQEDEQPIPPCQKNE